MKNKLIWLARKAGSLLLAALIIASASCQSPMPVVASGFNVLATTSIVADVVAQVGGKYITLTTLLPVGTDPHEFMPRPKDATALADATIVFSNGAGLESFLPSLLENVDAAGKVVEASAGIPLLSLSGTTGTDPHTWMDPNNVIVWTENIADALSKADPAHESDYQANAAAYATSLRDLDTWIAAQVDQIPPANRILVSDHAVLGYFAARYGFTQGGTITGSFSSEAAPSAQELAALENKIRADHVRAIFVTEASNQTLADQIAADTGIQAVWLYHASLTDTSGSAGTYLDFMRYNVNAIVTALK